MKKYPPYGRDLAERLQFGNIPFLVFVCIGRDAWTKAKTINNHGGESWAIVAPHDQKPDRIEWPVKRCNVVVDWSIGPRVDQIIDLCRSLLQSRASLVVIHPVFEDHSKPVELFDHTAQEWQRVRNGIKIYRAGEN